MVEDGAFSHKKDYVTIFEGHQKRDTDSRVTGILLNGWILPIGGASTVEGPLSTGPTLSSVYSMDTT